MRFGTLCILVVLCGCGGVDPGKNPDPVDVTLNVTVAGEPANDVKFNFQPTGAGALPAVVDVMNGTAQAKVTPGKYTYFITAGESPEGLEAVPIAFHEGSLARQIEVKAGDKIEVKLE